MNLSRRGLAVALLGALLLCVSPSLTPGAEHRISGCLTFLRQDTLVSLAPQAGQEAATIVVGHVEAYTWARGGDAVAYTLHDRPGSLFAANVSVAGVGTAGVVVASGFEGVRFPTWSPDGRTIVFTVDHTWRQPGRRQGAATSSLWAVSRDAGVGTEWGAPRPIGPPTTDPFESSWAPQWSPDGRALGFIKGRAPWVMEADGSRPRELGAGFLRVDSYGWFPDSSALVLAGVKADFETRIWRVPANGTPANVIVSNCDGDAGWPSASPNAQRILYTKGSPRRGTGGGKRPLLLSPIRLWVAGADGTEARLLLDRDDCSEACWSPDSANVACIVAGPHETWSLVLVDVATGGTRDILQTRSALRSLAWRP